MAVRPRPTGATRTGHTMTQPPQPRPKRSTVTTRRTVGPAKPPDASLNTVGSNSRRGPRVIVGSPIKPLPPKPPQPAGFPHDRLCLLIINPTTQVREIRTDLSYCWCMCPKCFSRDSQHCICRHCSCPAARGAFALRQNAHKSTNMTHYRGHDEAVRC